MIAATTPLLVHLSRTGPFTHRVLLTLEEKHVPYVKHYINTHDKPEWYDDRCWWMDGSSLGGAAS